MSADRVVDPSPEFDVWWAAHGERLLLISPRAAAAAAWQEARRQGYGKGMTEGAEWGADRHWS